ncbi:MAG: extracellular solute-binding protein [Meiothermus sp.]|nr:extracellular solute-binding protein [Meiothermus sp.]
MTRPKLRILVVGGPMYDGLYSSIQEFERQEGAQVEITRSDNHPDLNQRIHDSFSGGQGFDLISTHSKFVPAQTQWLSPLDHDFSSAELAHFNPTTLELARINGTLWSVPRNLDAKLLHYRTDLVSGPPTTWDELLRLGQTLTREGQYGFVFPGYSSGIFGHFFELCGSAGHYLYDQDPPVPHADTEAGRWALEMLGAWKTISPPESVDFEFDRVAAFFGSGRAAMTTDWPGSFNGYQASEIGGRFALALYPLGPARRATYSGSHTFALSRTAADRPLAVALLKFLTSRESQLLEARRGTLPARLDALEQARLEAEPFEARRWELLKEATQYSWIPPKHPDYPAVEAIVWQNVHAFLKGQKSAPEALRAIDTLGAAAARGRAG